MVSLFTGRRWRGRDGGHAPQQWRAVLEVSNAQKQSFVDNPTNLDTLALGEGDPRLLTANDEDVALTGSELVVNGVLDVDDVETTVVALTVSDDTNTAHVTTTSGHGDDTSVETYEVGDLASGEVNLDGVVDLDGGVGVTDTIQHNNSVSCPHMCFSVSPKLDPTADRCRLTCVHHA